MRLTFLLWIVVQMIFFFGRIAGFILLDWHLLLIPTWLYIFHFFVVMGLFWIKCWLAVHTTFFDGISVEFDKDEKLY